MKKPLLLIDYMQTQIQGIIQEYIDYSDGKYSELDDESIKRFVEGCIAEAYLPNTYNITRGFAEVVMSDTIMSINVSWDNELRNVAAEHFTAFETSIIFSDLKNKFNSEELEENFEKFRTFCLGLDVEKVLFLLNKSYYSGDYFSEKEFNDFVRKNKLPLRNEDDKSFFVKFQEYIVRMVSSLIVDEMNTGVKSISATNRKDELIRYAKQAIAEDYQLIQAERNVDDTTNIQNTETIDEILKDISVLQDELTTFDIPSIVYQSINKQLDRIYEKLEKHTNIEQEDDLLPKNCNGVSLSDKISDIEQILLDEVFRGFNFRGLEAFDEESAIFDNPLPKEFVEDARKKLQEELGYEFAMLTLPKEKDRYQENAVFVCASDKENLEKAVDYMLGYGYVFVNKEKQKNTIKQIRK